MRDAAHAHPTRRPIDPAGASRARSGNGEENMPSNRHVTVWIDHNEARLFRVDAESVDETTVRAPMKHVHRHPKGGTAAARPPRRRGCVLPDGRDRLADAERVLGLSACRRRSSSSSVTCTSTITPSSLASSASRRSTTRPTGSWSRIRSDTSRPTTGCKAPLKWRATVERPRRELRLHSGRRPGVSKARLLRAPAAFVVFATAVACGDRMANTPPAASPAPTVASPEATKDAKDANAAPTSSRQVELETVDSNGLPSERLHAVSRRRSRTCAAAPRAAAARSTSGSPSRTAFFE